MPLTPGQQALCALVFGTSLGVGGTVAVQKKVSPKPPVSAAAKGERVARRPSAPAVARPENRTQPAPRILDCPLIGSPFTAEPNPFVLPSPMPPGFGGGIVGAAPFAPQVWGGGGSHTPPPPMIPEPDAWTLWISGFGLIGLACRRRKAVA